MDREPDGGVIMDWRNEEWAVYDLETTGVDTLTACVVQVAVARFKGGQFLGAKQTLCNPGIPIPEEATEIHGITDAMVADQRSDIVVLSELAKWLANRPVIVTYNGFHYDDQVVAHRTGINVDALWQNAARVDALTLVRMNEIGRWWKGTGRHRLTSVAERLEIKAEGSAHDAKNDAIMTGRVLHGLLSHAVYGFHIERDIPLDRGVTAKMKELADKQEADFQRWLAKQPPKEEAKEGM